MKPEIFILLGVFAVACGTGTKPCSEGGDVSWSTEVKGDRTCFQKRSANGKLLNHGEYRQYYLNGKVAIEGDFRDGLKNGYWIQYNEEGRKIAERYYENGVEKSAAASAAQSKESR